MEEIVEAEVLEAESVSMELKVDYDPIEFTTNIEELKVYMQNQIEPFNDVELELNNKAAIKEAKKTYADLNSFVTDFDKRRKAVIKELRAPIDALDTELKGIVADGKEAYREGKNQLDDVAERQKEAKRSALMEEYYGMVGKLGDLIPYEVIEDTTWANASTTESKALNEMNEKAKKVLSDIKTLESTALEHKQASLTVYYKTVDIQQALAENTRLIAEEAERKEYKEKAQAVFTPPEIDQDEQIDTEEEQEKLPQWACSFTASRDDAKKVGDFLKSLGISGTLKYMGVSE